MYEIEVSDIHERVALDDQAGLALYPVMLNRLSWVVVAKRYAMNAEGWQGRPFLLGANMAAICFPSWAHIPYALPQTVTLLGG